MNTVAVIQARMGSERLPGKVMQDIAGSTMVERVVQRIRKCERVDAVVVATSVDQVDDPLASHCFDLGVDVIRGSESDVLSRYVLAAKASQASHIVRITADCPLIDPDIVDQVVTALEQTENADYASNFYPHRLFPRGLDAEAFSVEAIRRVDAMAIESRHREHVTLMIYENPALFGIASVSNRLDHSHLRWTVDTAADMQLIRTIYGHFLDAGVESFGYPEVMKALTQNWHWCQINKDVRQKAA